MPWREVSGPWRRWPAIILLAGLAVTVAGVVATARTYRDSERQLLDQQTREAGAVLTAAIGRTETALADAAILARATDGAAGEFERFADAMAERSGFVGAELLAADDPAARLAAGGEPLVGPAEQRASVDQLVADAVANPGTIRVRLIEGSARRLGYATTDRDDPRFVVYAETPLPDTPTRVGRTDGPFSDIDYGIYLGDAERSDLLLYTSVDEVPLGGRTSVITLPFADTGLTFASTPAAPLAGRFAQSAPWLLAIGGTIVSLLAALGTRSVLRRGHAAEALADRLAQLTRQQRAGIATLRSSLLPRRLDAPPGFAIHTGYWPADSDHEVSGDFYDAFRVDERRWALVIGDVCGKGAEAAALTGLTRHTIRAAARHLRSPADVLRWTHEAVAASGAETYVTACFVFVDVDDDGSARASVALGGHPAPLLCRDGRCRPIGEHGSLLGLFTPTLATTTVDLHVGDVLMLYTDGLTDVSGSTLDTTTLASMVEGVLTGHTPADVADALQSALRDARPHGTIDDSAILVAHVVGTAAGHGDRPVHAVSSASHAPATPRLPGVPSGSGAANAAAAG